MDVAKILEDLRRERQQIEEAIVSLERLARGRSRGRGRPPAWLNEVRKSTGKRRGRPPGSKNKAPGIGPAVKGGGRTSESNPPLQ